MPSNANAVTHSIVFIVLMVHPNYDNNQICDIIALFGAFFSDKQTLKYQKIRLAIATQKPQFKAHLSQRNTKI